MLLLVVIDEGALGLEVSAVHGARWSLFPSATRSGADVCLCLGTVRAEHFLLGGDLDGALVHRVGEAQTRHNLVLHAERNLNLVLATLLQRERLILQGLDGGRSVQSVHDIGTSLNDNLELRDDHTTRIVLGRISVGNVAQQRLLVLAQALVASVLIDQSLQIHLLSLFYKKKKKNMRKKKNDRIKKEK